MKVNFENILSQAMELKENGEPEHKILERFPAYAKDLEEVFSAVKNLQTSKEAIEAPQDLLKRIIQQLPETPLPETPQTGVVTKTEQPRYTKYNEAAKGRTFLIELKKVFKTSFARVFVPTGLAVVLLVITLAAVQLPKKDNGPSNTVPAVTNPAATAKPNGAADAGSISEFKQRVQKTKTNVPPGLIIARPDTTRPKPRSVGL